MATYDTIQRQVMLRSNQLKADDASALATNYAVTGIGATELGDRAIEFPKLAIDDAILNAADKMVTAIGENRMSEYRPHFADVTDNIAHGGAIPTLSTNSKPIVGVLGTIRDATDSRECEYKALALVRAAVTAALKSSFYYYGTNGHRIWHTRTNVVADCVVFSKTDQLALMATDPRGDCPFPEGLHEGLVCGALSYMFRQNFNIEQVQAWRAYFNETLASLAAE